jgi:outer membrane protein OmpA-like peptidoglycan-associated protein
MTDSVARAKSPPSPGHLAALLLGAGLFSTASLEAPSAAGRSGGVPYTTLDPPTLELRLGRDRLALNATSASQEHDAELEELVAELFPASGADLRLRPGVLVPDSWRPLSLELLRAVSMLESAEASAGPARVSIRGVTANPDGYEARVAALRAALPSSVSLEERVTKLAPAPGLRALCDRTFAGLGSARVEFERASTALRTTAYALLDRLIEFAWDCHDVGLRITGHSDAAGDESWNLDLSRQRAQAVADYLVRGGIARERLYVVGMGSAAPIADNATAHGRRLNRRIEFGLLEEGSRR